jgi:ketosteroid isomerase-like protein
MRTLLIGCTLAAVAMSLTACGSSGSPSASEQKVQKEAQLYEIDQVEKTWHRAASTHDVDLMMTLWAPNATFSTGGQTYTGKAEIRKVIAQAGPWQPQNHWVSDTPAYKIRTTVDGNVGTLYFQCHYVDTRTDKVVHVLAADQNVKKINGTWLITSSVAASPTLSP